MKRQLVTLTAHEQTLLAIYRALPDAVRLDVDGRLGRACLTDRTVEQGVLRDADAGSLSAEYYAHFISASTQLEQSGGVK